MRANSPKIIGMTKNKLLKRTNIKLSAGHLLVIWDVLSNKLSGSDFMGGLDKEEKRALWALQDMCERSLIKVEVSELPESEWNALVASAREHIRLSEWIF